MRSDSRSRRSSSSTSVQPIVTWSRLLKLCATPAASWPTASIFCALRICSSVARTCSSVSRRRASLARRAALTLLRPAISCPPKSAIRTKSRSGRDVTPNGGPGGNTSGSAMAAIAVASSAARPLPQCATAATVPKTAANGAAEKNGQVRRVTATLAAAASTVMAYVVQELRKIPFFDQSTPGVRPRGRGQRPRASRRPSMRTALTVGFALLVAAAPSAVQQPPAAASQEPIILGPPPPPATALEAFQARPGEILSTAYEDLGEVSGVFVEAREMRETGAGRRVRGIVVTIGNGRQGGAPDVAFIDRDEIGALLKGFDALLAITTNPSGEWRNFDMRYSTRGELVLTASSTRQRGVVYGVEVGRVLRVRRRLDGGEFHQLKILVEAAQQKLNTLSGER